MTYYFAVWQYLINITTDMGIPNDLILEMKYSCVQ